MLKNQPEADCQAAENLLEQSCQSSSNLDGHQSAQSKQLKLRLDNSTCQGFEDATTLALEASVAPSVSSKITPIVPKATTEDNF